MATNTLLAAAKVGALSGAAGLIYGGFSGVIRSPNPTIHSLSCGIHWFACGSTYWWMRSNVIALHYQDNVSPRERAYVSGLCGGISGGVVTRMMGGRLVPGLVIFSLLGYGGQTAFNYVDRWQMEKAQSPSKPFLQRVAESKWIPFRHLSDQEYREMLSEKLLSVEAEIALLDEKIEDLEKTRPNSAPKPPNGKS
ncbi:hypothetical protein PDE_07769 [Penicillium oxalicum 114-2]|uniref:Mitochondrial inner membrane translocase subunit Tim17/Tim22/Tim23/peroxisomal protein PMP24 n=1 Tax=Penicillium oxalicum (strain 114-2 / CGMCC 5302) TaxID=933388 RepID=S7ZQY8_PENO1|nr:hypothetical protein PDE_07769 [Penicillium oxalicum 114-2]